MPVLGTAPAGTTAHRVQAPPAPAWGSLIGYTTFDLQTNSSAANRLRVLSNGRVSAVWTQTCALGSQPAFTNRGVGYNQRQGTTWANGSSGNCPSSFGINNVRTGWPELVESNGQEIVFSHTATNLVRTQRPVGGGAWSSPVALSFTANIGGTGAGTWPRAVAGNGNTIHLIYAASGLVANGVSSPLYYARSLDGGVTWDRQNVALPLMSSPTFTALAGDAYALAARGNTVAIVAGTLGANTVLWKSTDNGTTFTAQVIQSLDAADVLPGSSDRAYTVDGSFALGIDPAGRIHLVLGEAIAQVTLDGNGTPTFANAYFAEGNRLLYWNDAELAGVGLQVLAGLDGFVPAGAAFSGVATGTAQVANPYHSTGLVSMPTMSFDAGGNLYLIYAAATRGTTNNAAQGESGQPYRDLYLMRGTPCGGRMTWGQSYQISRQLLGITNGAAAQGQENVYPIAAPQVGADNLLHYIWLNDREPGTALQPTGSADAETESGIVYHALDVTTLPTAPQVPQPYPAACAFSGPITVTATSPACGGTLVLGATGVPTGWSYAWTGPNGFTSTQAAPAVTNVGTAQAGTYALTVSQCGTCLVTGSVTRVFCPPTISSFAPAGGPPSAEVTLTGTNFVGTTTVTFNGVPATSFTIDSNTSLRVLVPAGATTGKLTVSNSQGSATTTADFTVCATPPPPPGFSYLGAFGGKFYYQSTGRLTWTAARQACRAAGGDLVTVNSAAENAFLTAFATAINDTYWIGLSDAAAEGTYVWSNGEPATYFNWGPGEPNNFGGNEDYVQIYPNGVWNDNADNGAVGGLFAVLELDACVPAPTVSSFTPGSGVVGSSVTVTGANFRGVTSVLFGTVAATFAVSSPTTLTATVPPGIATGKLTVTGTYGSGTSTSSYRVVPTVSSFTPQAGAPGTVVTITGTGFTGATTVKFGTVSAATLTVNSPTSISVAVPAAAVTGRLAVTTPGGTGTSVASFTVAPIVTGFLPAQGAPGSVVLVQGLNFTSTTNVAFNGLNAAKTYNTTTQLTAIMPAGAATGPITAANTTGTGTSAAAFTVVSGVLPTISSFAPTANVIAGTSITLTGTNFTGATLVRFNNVNATSFTVNSSTSITATVPAKALTGRIYVATPAGMAQSAASLTIIQPPTLTSVAPTTGAVGSVVLLGGANLTGATSVTLNGAPVPYTVSSAAQILVTLPPGATSGRFAVTTIAGTAQSAATFAVVGGPVPTITNLDLSSAPRGASVVVTGTNLGNATSVKLGTVAATFTVQSATQLTFTVPLTATTNRLYVITPTGMAQSPTVLTVLLTPTISSFSPGAGPVGTLVTINGTNFTGTTAVRFGGVAASSFTLVSASRLTATVPPGAATGTVQVTNPAGTATSVGTFSVTGSRAPTAAPAAAEVLLFPNPAQVWVSLLLRGAATTTAQLFDGQGRLLREVVLVEGDNRLDISGLPGGVYLVRAAGQQQRLVIE